MKAIFRGCMTAFFFLILWPWLFLDVKGKKLALEELNGSILIANHYSNFDPFLIKKLFFKKNITFVADVAVKKKLWSRLLTWSFNCLYVKEDEVNIEVFKKSKEILSKGGTIVIFPEGYVNRRKYGILGFRKGFALMAKMAKARIIPLYMYPTGTIFKKNLVVIDKIYTYENYREDDTLDAISSFFESKMLELHARNN